MFRHVPECSGMFRVPGFIDSLEAIIVYIFYPPTQTFFGVNHAFPVCGEAGTRDEPLRTSAWEVYILKQYP